MHDSALLVVPPRYEKQLKRLQQDRDKGKGQGDQGTLDDMKATADSLKEHAVATSTGIKSTADTGSLNAQASLLHCSCGTDTVTRLSELSNCSSKSHTPMYRPTGSLSRPSLVTHVSRVMHHGIMEYTVYSHTVYYYPVKDCLLMATEEITGNPGILDPGILATNKLRTKTC